jgi:hypothetical protein
VRDLSAKEWQFAHHYYHANDELTDLKQMRDEAHQRAADQREPENSVIHFHPYKDNQGFCLYEGRHEQYRIGEGLVKEDGGN